MGTRVKMNNKYLILFCRRNPADADWIYKLTPKAVFLKEFNSLEDVAKFIADNVYVPCIGEGIGQINSDSQIVIWKFRMKPNEITIVGDKLAAICRKRLIYNA